MTEVDTDLRSAADERLRFETLLTDILARFVALPPDQVDGAIVDAQRHIVEALGLDRSSLWQFGDPPTELCLTHAWHRPGLQAFPAWLNAAASFPWAHERLLAGAIVRFASIDELPPEAAQDVASFRQFGPKSNVTVPLRAGGRVFGGLAFGTLQEEHHWPEALVARLRLVADIFANTLARKESEEHLRHALEDVQRLKDQLQQEVVYLQQEVKTLHGHAGITGTSAALREVLAQVERVAPTDATVLLLGETGTGKELLAEAIHAQSPRRARVMIKVNCAGLAATLIEAELFGREKGAYTGAVSRQAGRFELADGATLFLDEVADLPLDLQPKLLRVLQDGQFERVGGTQTLRVDISAYSTA